MGLMRILLLVAIMAPSLAWAYRPKDVAITKECQWNQRLHYASADCNHLYNHYPPKREVSQVNPARKQLRLGSFNIYRLGYRQTKYKNLELIAEVFNNRWDLVAMSELQHNMSEKLEFNVEAMLAYEKGMAKRKVLGAYEIPAYLQLLKELQKLDPTWGLILSPFGQGWSNELYGFYYRQKQVEPMPSKYCKDQLRSMQSKPFKLYGEISLNSSSGLVRYRNGKNTTLLKPKTQPVACTLGLKGKHRHYFSKVPLVGRFKSGRFDFSYVSLHLRFRRAGTKSGNCKQSCKDITIEMAEELGIPINYIPAPEVARFYEVMATLKETVKINNIEGDKDTIITGDFNLEAGRLAVGNRNKVWDRVLKHYPGSKIYVEDKTSISKLNGLANNYDHFIFAPGIGSTTECDPKSAKSIDFTSPNFKHADYFAYVSQPKNFASVVENFMHNLNGRYRIEDRQMVAYPIWEVSDQEQEEFLSQFSPEERPRVMVRWSQIIEDRVKNCKTGKREHLPHSHAVEADFYCQILWHSPKSRVAMKSRRKPFQIYTGLISDHLPIEMACRTDQSND